jgi:hypothetical protein
MVLNARVTDIPLIHFTCHGQWDEGDTKWRPHIENYSNIIINMHKVWLDIRLGTKGKVFFFLAIT